MEVTHAFTAQLRGGIGKSANKKLKAAGRIPGVIYGPHVEPRNLSLNLRDFSKFFETFQHRVQILRLDIVDDQGKEVESVNVAVREVQFHKVKDTAEHIDFFQFDPQREISIGVPVKLEGRPVGVEMGGMLQFAAPKLRVLAKPADLPRRIVIDVSKLDVGQRLTVADLKKMVDHVFDEEDQKVIAQVIALRKARAKAQEEAAAATEGAAAEASS